MAASKPYYRNRIQELDLLRGMAIILVLLRHYPLLPGFRQCWIGVDIFFTLSGFLVAGILIREYQEKGAVRIGRFLIRRGMKIYPSFYFFLFFTMILAAVLRMAGKPVLFDRMEISHILTEIFYLQSFRHGLWWHTWSLAVEEHFYFLLAFLVWMLSRGRQMTVRLLLVSIVFIPLCLVLRLRTAVEHPEFSYILHYNNTFLRLDSLFFGVGLAAVYYHFQDRLKVMPKWTWYALITAGLLILTTWLSTYPLEHMATAKYGFSVIYIGFGAVLFGLMGRRLSVDYIPLRGNPIIRGVLAMGRNSYNIYLWHAFALEAMILTVYVATGESAFVPMKWYYFTAYVMVSIALGGLATRFIEIPLLRWRDRRFAGAGRLN